MRGTILNCEIAVRTSMMITSMWLNPKTRALPNRLRLWINELARNSRPETKPIQCSFSKESRTTSPAKWLDGSTENEV